MPTFVSFVIPFGHLICILLKITVDEGMNSLAAKGYKSHPGRRRFFCPALRAFHPARGRCRNGIGSQTGKTAFLLFFLHWAPARCCSCSIKISLFLLGTRTLFSSFRWDILCNRIGFHNTCGRFWRLIRSMSLAAIFLPPALLTFGSFH